MIAQSARIVLIDDKLHHLHGLTKALGKLDSACLPFQFEDQGPSRSQLKHARVIFSDLYLLSDSLTGDTKQQLANIVSMLSEGLDENHGPYVLVIWTENPDKLADLNGYLEALAPGQRPIDYICFNKSEYINPGDGSLINEAGLIEKIQTALGAWSGVSALLWWETAVANAAAGLATSLWEFAGGNDNLRSEGLRQTFGKLAIASAGYHNAKDYPGMSVNETLVPLLADRLEQANFPSKIWKDAVEFEKFNLASPVSRLNSLIHLDFSRIDDSTQRGAASNLLGSWKTDQGFHDKFGYPKREIIRDFGFGEGKIDEVLKDIEWYLIQVSASCDQAQRNNNLIPFILAATISEKGNKTASGSVWKSKPLEINGKSTTIYAHSSFILGMRASECGGMRCAFRLRSALLDSLIFSARTHAARPGTIDVV